jgi:hypothetical protein
MTFEEHRRFLKKNKEEADLAVKEFEQHSKAFDNKIKKILFAL